MKNFIEVEKTDEEQAEQIKKWIKENALQIIMGVSLGLGGLEISLNH
jgi:predicted negative regulator of RcsB-dependent stress response